MSPDNTTPNNTPETSALVETPDQTNAIVEANAEAKAAMERPAQSEGDMMGETEALIDAIRKRALAEAQAAEELSRDTYLNAVRNARETIEQNKLIDPDRLEHSVQELQAEAEKNWQSLVNQVQEFGDRLSEAATTAWDILMGKTQPPKH